MTPVAWLLERGWDAHGVDVADRYLHFGREYLRREGHAPDRLQLAEPDGTYPLDDGSFDVVISDQVLEHVADLETYVREVSRVSAPGSTGHFAYPARWRPLEAHLRAPLVHWLPKGRARRTAISAALRAGLAAPYFEEYPFDVRVEIFTRYSEEETYYRSLRRVLRTFRRHGFVTDAAASARDKVAFYRPQWPSPVVGLVAMAYRHLQSVVLETYRP